MGVNANATNLVELLNADAMAARPLPDGRKILETTNGGEFVNSVPSGAGSTTVKTGAGVLCNVVVTTAGTGTGSVQLTDGASGTVIAAIPATVSIATSYQFNMPFNASLVVVNVASGPVLAVSFI